MDDTESRPRRGSEKRQKSGVIGFRATPIERTELETAAEQAGLTLGSYIRAKTLTAPKLRAVPRPTVERELLAKAVAQLGRMNGNLHQIARHLNFGGSLPPDLSEALAEVKGAGAAVMGALGRTRR